MFSCFFFYRFQSIKQRHLTAHQVTTEYSLEIDDQIRDLEFLLGKYIALAKKKIIMKDSVHLISIWKAKVIVSNCLDLEVKTGILRKIK